MAIKHEIESALLVSPCQNQWKTIGIRHHHGINIPLFALHSHKSCGIGEFTDLIPLFNWCKQVGMDTIQLLPLNDTGMDPSPYNALSAFALNPIYLSLSHLPHIEQYSDLQELIKKLKLLNATSRVSYKAVLEGKLHFLLEYFLQEFDQVALTEEYCTFIKENTWLKGYALFKTIKILSDWHGWESWEENLKNPNESKMHDLAIQLEKGIALHSFTQYLCYLQMRQVKEVAEASGIFLQGDIPILISRDSADVWLKRYLFDLQHSAGAPPDVYSEEGQNWGFPLYNWDELKNEDYHWWRQRLNYADNFYHLYRIDHIVGFFRIWGIPLGEIAKKGKFIPEDSSKWIDHGRNLMLMMLETSPMLPIGEDLGTVPPGVRICLKMLGICGTKVMRWERYWDDGGNFINPKEYSPESVTTVSTHDTSTLQLWWQQNPNEAILYSNYKGWEHTERLTIDHHREILWDSHHSSSLFHINLLQEYLALFAHMAWPDPEDERINVPGIISEHNWTYRYRLCVEKLVADESLQEMVISIIC